MAKWVLGRKKKPEFVSPPSNSNCNCPAIMILHFKEKFSDDQTRVYYCINPACGKVFMALPNEYANAHPNAREHIRGLAKELKLPKLDYKPKSS